LGFFQRRLRHAPLGLRSVELAFQARRQRRVGRRAQFRQRIAPLAQAILRARESGARRIEIGPVRAVRAPVGGGLVERGARIGDSALGIGSRVLGLAPIRRRGRRRLVVARALVLGDLGVGLGDARQRFLVFVADPKLAGKHFFVGLDQDVGDTAARQGRGDLELAGARLDDEEAVARVAEADAQVALHKRARNDQSAPAASADRRKAEHAAADAERGVADARGALDKATADWRAGGAAKTDLDAARTALTRAEERLRERRDALAKLKASPDTPLPTRLEGELNVAQAEWRVAQAALEKTQIRAPADGVVLRVDAKAGELSVPSIGPAMLVIGDMSGLRVRAEVNEQDLGRIRVGQSVLVRAGAFRGREFEGKVAAVARVVGPSRINSGDPRKFSVVDVLEVLVDLPNPGPLVVGEQVDVYFKSERFDQAETQ
jgi:HlyD family secretion protein